MSEFKPPYSFTSVIYYYDLANLLLLSLSLLSSSPISIWAGAITRLTIQYLFHMWINDNALFDVKRWGREYGRFACWNCQSCRQIMAPLALQYDTLYLYCSLYVHHLSSLALVIRSHPAGYPTQSPSTYWPTVLWLSLIRLHWISPPTAMLLVSQFFAPHHNACTSGMRSVSLTIDYSQSSVDFFSWNSSFSMRWSAQASGSGNYSSDASCIGSNREIKNQCSEASFALSMTSIKRLWRAGVTIRTDHKSMARSLKAARDLSKIARHTSMTSNSINREQHVIISPDLIPCTPGTEHVAASALSKAWPTGATATRTPEPTRNCIALCCITRQRKCMSTRMVEQTSSTEDLETGTYAWWRPVPDPPVLSTNVNRMLYIHHLAATALNESQSYYWSVQIRLLCGIPQLAQTPITTAFMLMMDREGNALFRPPIIMSYTNILSCWYNATNRAIQSSQYLGALLKIYINICDLRPNVDQALRYLPVDIVLPFSAGKTDFKLVMRTR